MSAIGLRTFDNPRKQGYCPACGRVCTSTRNVSPSHYIQMQAAHVQEWACDWCGTFGVTSYGSDWEPIVTRAAKR